MAQLIYSGDSERKDMAYRGMVAELDELIGLPDVIKDHFKNKKSEV